ncbi:MAG: hypothetical protein Kow0029_02880 [Candidatus Rifleibacteriota bacterium]
MKKLYTAVFLLLTFLKPSFAKDLIWPLDIEISQSSSFAEFRGFRFHAGIDLRTKRQNGFPVRAIADGFISRIKVQYRGYGYALYIDHPELKTRVVYGHLQDFAGEPGLYVKKKLQRIGKRFGIDDFFGPDRFPVKKGQIVAYSGESGSGPSHLHFETRTFADEPFAPAKLGYRPPDNIFPAFHKFYLEPFSFPCEINRSFLPFSTNLTKKKIGVYSLPEPIAINGSVAIQTGVSDNNGMGNVFGVEKISLKLNGEETFSRDFNQFSYTQNSECPQVYDYFKSNMKHTGYVVNLFKGQQETLPFSKDYKPFSGVISSDKIGEQAIVEVNARDFGGHEIQLSGNLKSGQASYSKQISGDIVKDFIFNKFVATKFYYVACGFSDIKRKREFSRGMIACSNAKGQKDLLPCIVEGNNIEIAVPIDEKWQGGVWVDKTRIFPDMLFVGNSGRKVSSEDGGVAQFDSGSVFSPVFAQFYISKRCTGEMKSVGSGKLKSWSPVWRLSPADVVFSKDVLIKIKTEGYNGNFKKLGIYSISENGNCRHIGENVDGNWLIAKVRAGGDWLILEDNQEPVIKYKRRSKDYHLGRIWVFKVKDVGEGVDYLSATAKAGKRSLEVYSDPDKSEIYVVREGIKGAIDLELSVKDYAGNTCTIIKKLK